MGFLLYNGDRPVDQSNDGLFFLRGPYTIVISTVLGTLSVLSLVALAAYCYRRPDYHGKRDTPLIRKDEHNSRQKPAKSSIYHINRAPDPIFKIGLKDLHHQRVLNNPTLTNRNYQISARDVRRLQVPGQYHTHPNNGLRITKFPFRPVHMQYKSPTLIHQTAVKPMAPSVEHPNTVPHMRLGAYKPKVIQDYFSPYNIRQYTNRRSPNSSIRDSSFSSPIDNEVRHTWVQVGEQVNVLHLDKNGVPYNPYMDKPTQRSGHLASARVTIDDNKYKEFKSPKPHNDSFTIVDYLVDRTPPQGPLSTSTPRNGNSYSLDMESDSEPDYRDLHQRQRKPHVGSIDKIPLLF